MNAHQSHLLDPKFAIFLARNAATNQQLSTVGRGLIAVGWVDSIAPSGFMRSVDFRAWTMPDCGKTVQHTVTLYRIFGK